MMSTGYTDYAATASLALKSAGYGRLSAPPLSADSEDDSMHGDAATPTAAAAATPVAAARPSKKVSESGSMQHLRAFIAPMDVLSNAYDDLPDLQEGNVPCFSASASKDKPQDSYTEPGYALIKKSKTKRIANYNAQLIVVEQAISKLRDCFNQACEKEYEQQRYRQHLVALQLLRNEEEQERVARAVAAEELALENVAGRRERMEKLETHIKRKKLGTDEGKKRSVFDL
jgi:hypothetical protein